ELDPNSACIDAGNNSSLPLWLNFDYDATSRVFNSTVDIGPQEYCSIGVPQDFNTIQQATNSAQSGDEIIVSPGTYYENIDFLTKNIRMRSINPLDTNCVSQTIIDGNDLDSCITISSGQDSTTVVAGFKIQHGNGEFGGGILVSNSVGPIVMYNYISDNNAIKLQGQTTGGYGGGVDYRWDSNGTVINNTIINNYASHAGGGVHLGPGSACRIIGNKIINNTTIGEAGGGIYCYDNTIAWIIDNEISGNEALSGNGGGIWQWGSPGGIIERNIITNNTATEADTPYGVGRGGGMGFLSAATLIQNNIVCGNIADEGGGVWIQSGGTCNLRNNTIVGNRAIDGGGIGTAFSVTSPVTNNIITGNLSGGGVYVNPLLNTGEPNLIANDVWNNGGGNYAGDINDHTGIKGNISADPCFADTGYFSDNGTPTDVNDDYWVMGNYKIGYYSPCRDTATSQNAPSDDFETDLRPYFNGFDMGAYELQVYDITVTGTIDFTDVTLIVDSWLCSVSSHPADLDGNGVIDFYDFALLANGWHR
ncbi:MAG: right-handed parallel beta-helix repeat-containing protein, partial [Planctomycetota bacterium]